jgi:hypothetical protein
VGFVDGEFGGDGCGEDEACRGVDEDAGMKTVPDVAAGGGDDDCLHYRIVSCN